MRSVGLSFVAPIELMSDGITADAGFIRVGAPGLGRRVSYCSPAKQRRDHDRFVTGMHNEAHCRRVTQLRVQEI